VACRLCCPRSAFEIVSLETPARLASSEIVRPASARAILNAFSVGLLLCLTLSKIFRFFKHAVKRHKIWGYVQRAVTLGGGCPA
jgi:predicted membrane channel-forming protein YqfA (hemolysin III family)